LTIDLALIGSIKANDHLLSLLSRVMIGFFFSIFSASLAAPAEMAAQRWLFSFVDSPTTAIKIN